MRIGTKVAEYLIGSPEGWFAIDHPVGSEKLADKIPENLGLSKSLEKAVELEHSRRKVLL